MLNVTLQKDFIFERGEDARALVFVLSRDIKLPFVPYPGLDLELGDAPPDRIFDVMYCMDIGCFLCHCEEVRLDELDIPDAHARTGFLKTFVDDGWEIVHETEELTAAEKEGIPQE